MKILKCFLIGFFLVILFQNTSCLAKNVLNPKNASVILLKKLTDTGKEIRKNDSPIEKTNTDADTCRVKEIKNNYYKEYNLNRKIPD